VEPLKAQLRAALAGARRPAVLGAGSDLLGDDRAGLLVARALQGSGGTSFSIAAFEGGTAPENQTGEIRRYRPSHLLVVDAAELGGASGEVAIVPQESIATTAFSTHILPLNLLAECMQQSIGCKVAVIGIQPKTMRMEAPISAEVGSAVAELVLTIRELADECAHGPEAVLRTGMTAT
jgi:hydrogenase 3 maturation protease